MQSIWRKGAGCDLTKNAFQFWLKCSGWKEVHYSPFLLLDTDNITLAIKYKMREGATARRRRSENLEAVKKIFSILNVFLQYN